MKFYFDYISPYAYIAWTQIRALAAKYEQTIEPIPVLFAGMLQESGRLGPAETPLLRRWMWKNVMRKCAGLGIPLKPPATHPFNPLLPLRVTALEMGDDQREQLIDLIFAAVWANSQDVTDVQVVGPLLSQVGLDPESAFAQVQLPAVKQRIRENTAAAISNGAFGVPTMIVDGELFWGHDDFCYLETFLQGETSYDTAELEAWAAVKASASR